MRIGIDARAAAEEPGGRGRMVRELLRALARRDDDHRYVLFARERWDEGGLNERFAWELSSLRDPLWHVAAALRASRRCDAYLSTNSYLTAWFTRVPATIVVHDMVPFVVPEVARRRASRIERATLRPAVRRAAAIVTVSESTRRDLVRIVPAAAGKARVVHHAADPGFAPDGSDGDAARRLGVEKRFVLVTGTLEPRKNLTRLIAAFTGLPADLRESYDLVVVGASGWETDEIFSEIRANADAVRTLGYVSEHDLQALFRAAELVCYPSLYEGFGLPVLEAMQSGTAVLTSNVSSLPEVGGDAARYVDPYDVADIRAGIESLLRNPEERARRARLGVKRAREFSWDRAAREVLAVLETTG